MIKHKHILDQLPDSFGSRKTPRFLFQHPCESLGLSVWYMHNVCILLFTLRGEQPEQILMIKGHSSLVPEY